MTYISTVETTSVSPRPKKGKKVPLILSHCAPFHKKRDNAISNNCATDSLHARKGKTDYSRAASGGAVPKDGQPCPLSSGEKNPSLLKAARDHHRGTKKTHPGDQKRKK